jgi:integrase
MARTVKTGKLTALDVSRAKDPGLYGDGAGLYLRVQKDGSKTWAFRFTLGRAREMGLGPLHTLTLAEARERAKAARLLVLDGKDPIEVRRDMIATAKADLANAETFKACAERYIESHKAGWKNAKHVYQWRATMKAYVYPAIGETPVARIGTADVLKILEPLWSSKSETAARVRGRIEKVLDWARVRGYRAGENPARWKGHLENALPKLSDVRKVEHHPALAYAQLGSFMKDLRRHSGVAADALQFTILCAVRTNETVGAQWSEIDWENNLWVIPAERMKGRKSKAREHRVPLSTQAVVVLKRMAELGTVGFIFPGLKEGRPLSNMAMLETLRRMGKDFTVHGFRSTFSDWARETTAYPRDVVEMALAHAIKDKAEAAYFRADLIEKRRALMQAWADYTDRVPVSDGSNIIQMSLALG